jgi:hypothetical protein
LSLLRRTLVLAAVAIGGLALLAPLAARSAVADAVPDAIADRLLTVADAPSPIRAARGALAGRQGDATAVVGPAGTVAETLAPSAETPPVAPMEATLLPVPRAAPPSTAPRAVTYAGSSVWDDLARCESGGNWAANTGNGYYGGLQFSHGTWHGYGGGEFAEYPHEATRDEQIVVAERLRAARGYQPWPACRVKLGLP